MTPRDRSTMMQLQQENDRLTTQCDRFAAQSVRLQTELAEARSHLEILQQENECFAAQCDRLRQSESRYRQIFDNAPISILLINSQGYPVEANQACEQLFGTTLEQMKTRSIFERPELVENGTLPHMQRAFAGEAVVEPPTYYDAAGDGGIKLFGQGYYAPIRDEFGIIQEIVEIAPDTSDLVAAQQALQQERDRAAQERARLLSTIAQVANLLLRSPDYTTVLPDVVRLLGEAVGSDRCCLTRETSPATSAYLIVEILEEWCRAGIPGTLESDPEMEALMLRENFAVIREKFYQGEATNFLVTDLPEPTRSIFAAQGNTSMLVVPIMVQGKHWGEIGFDNCGEPRLYDEAEIAILRIAADSIAAAIERQAKDDELRKSEALYRSLFEISNEGIFRWELDQPIPLSLSAQEQVDLVYANCRITQANDACLAMIGISSIEEVSHLRLIDLHVNDSEKNKSLMLSYIENGWQIRNAESEEVDVSGQKRYFLNSIISFIENDRVTGGWGTQIDITELREAQQALLQTEQERSQELERLNAELQQAIDRLSESEERYRTLFEISSEGIFRVEYDPPIPLHLSLEEQIDWYYRSLHFAEGNATFASMYGFDNPKHVIGMQLRDIHVPTSEQNQTFMRMLVENRYQLRNAETEELGLNGNPRYFLNNITTVIKDGYAIGGWASQLDITELRLAQQALLEAEQQRVAELAKTNQALKNSIDRLAADPDLNAFLGHVVLEITQQLNLHTAWVELYQPSTQTLRMHLFVEQGQLRLEPNLPDMGKLNQGYLANEDIAWNWLSQTKQPLVITLDTLPQFFVGDELAALQQWGLNKGIQSGINIALMMGNEPLGLLVLFSTERSTFTKEELELAQALAQQATLAIALTRLAEESRQLAIIRDRTHLAREIHDTLAQGYAGILMQIQAANFLKQQPESAKVHLDRACALAREGLADARRSVWLLQQESDAYGDLSSILMQLVEQMAIGTGIKPNIAIEGTPRSIKPDLGMHLLRITQESFNNAIRHAQASAIEVCLHYFPKQLQITIQDNGCGFETDHPSGGFGIKGMQQRAELIGAELHIQSQPNQGTQIQLMLPLP